MAGPAARADAAKRGVRRASWVAITRVAPEASACAQQQLEHRRAVGVVERRGRLVGQDQRRPVDHGARDRDPLRLALAELAPAARRPAPRGRARSSSCVDPRRDRAGRPASERARRRLSRTLSAPIRCSRLQHDADRCGRGRRSSSAGRSAARSRPATSDPARGSGAAARRSGARACSCRSRTARAPGCGGRARPTRPAISSTVRAPNRWTSSISSARLRASGPGPERSRRPGGPTMTAFLRQGARPHCYGTGLAFARYVWHANRAPGADRCCGRCCRRQRAAPGAAHAAAVRTAQPTETRMRFASLAGSLLVVLGGVALARRGRRPDGDRRRA